MARKIVTFTGTASAGNISASGAKAGDEIVFAATADGTDLTSLFAKFVLTDGEVIYLSGHGSTYDGTAFTAVLERDIIS